MKKTFGIILTICFVLTAALQPAALAQMTSGGPTPEELAAAKEITVECDGSGATRQDALRDAMRKAIEKAVGMYVLSKTTMTYQELKEQVIVTSDAVVTNYKEIKSEEEERGWTVRTGTVRAEGVSLHLSVRFRLDKGQCPGIRQVPQNSDEKSSRLDGGLWSLSNTLYQLF